MTKSLLPVAILAGGLATRLRPITETIPKALIDIGGQPFIVHQLRDLYAQGVRKVVLCVGYLCEQIEAVVGDGKVFGLEVIYSRDGNKLLGTGGAIKRALPFLEEQFFVLYGDSYLPCNFKMVEDRFRASGKLALMTVLQNADRWDKSNVVFKDGTLIEYNKNAVRPEMNYIDYGLGILSASVFEHASNNEPFDLAGIYHKLSTQGQLVGYEVFERFYEIGSHSGLEETINYFNQRGSA